jgi:hypothetical protein
MQDETACETSYPVGERDEATVVSERLNGALRRVVLLKETGPKSAAWHRARVRTIWRLHRLLDEAQPTISAAEAPEGPREPQA